MVHLRCHEPVRIQKLSYNQVGLSNEMARPTLIFDGCMDSGHSSMLQHSALWALSSHLARSVMKSDRKSVPKVSKADKVTNFGYMSHLIAYF